MEVLLPRCCNVLHPLYLLLLSLVISTTIATTTTSNTPSPVLKVIQQAARDGTTRSITLLSSGYTVTEQSQFDADVKVVFETLLGKDAAVDASPWSRYAPLMNMYSVFEASDESGARRKKGYGHKCGRMHDCSEKEVRNNLFCVFGTPDPSVLSCDRGAVLSLATHAPAQDILAVLVNEPKELAETSGTGIAIFTNSKSFLPLFTVRGLSVAFASLASEYSRGLEEEKKVTIPNCAASLSEAQWKWRDWIKAGVGNPTPVRGCFFDNYYRLTNNGCMLHDSSVNVLCASCREAVNAALVRNAPSEFLAATRCPPNGHTVHVEDNTPLSLDSGALGTAPGVKISWRHEDDPPVTLASGGVIVIPETTLKTWSFPTVVKVTIEDESPFVRQSMRSEAFKVDIAYPVAKKDKSVYCVQKNCTKAGPVCLSCSGDLCSVTVPANHKKVNWTSDKNAVSRDTKDSHIAAWICSVIAVGLLCILLAVYFFYYHRQPHEVLAATVKDNLIRILLMFLCIVCIVVSTVGMVFALKFGNEKRFLWDGVFLPWLILGSLMYVAALINFATVLFGLYILALICGFLFMLFGLFFVGVGSFFLLSEDNREKDSLVSLVAYYWSSEVEHNPSRVCSEQWEMNCSGFYDSCLEVNGSYCPSGCKSNAFAEPCIGPLMHSISSHYFQIGVGSVIIGTLMLVFAWLSALYCSHFRLLSLSGRRRRRLRIDPYASQVYITFGELERVQTFFNNVSNSDATLSGPKCISFLQKVFNERLSEPCRNELRCKDSINFVSLMRLYFPYFDIRRMDPRQLTPDETSRATDAVELQRLQYQKLEEFKIASGVLSPEVMHSVFQTYARSRFILDHDELMECLRREDEACDNEKCMFRGLTPDELEGLRAAWVSLHPSVLGSLTDKEIDLFYQWSHEKPLRSSQEFYAWKKLLDVQNRGCIGWTEFCYPYAQRALLRDARVALEVAEMDIPPELFTRELVSQRFGAGFADEIFLPFEDSVPVERVFEQIVNSGEL